MTVWAGWARIVTPGQAFNCVLVGGSGEMKNDRQTTDKPQCKTSSNLSHVQAASAQAEEGAESGTAHRGASSGGGASWASTCHPWEEGFNSRARTAWDARWEGSQLQSTHSMGCLLGQAGSLVLE